MQIYFTSLDNSVHVPLEYPLDCSEEQAIDVLERINFDDGGELGFVVKNYIIIQIFKINKFLYQVEIPMHRQNGSYQVNYNHFQLIRMIKHLFHGLNPFLLKGLIFVKNDFLD